ncbi:MAG: EVE domain-containing protein [Lutisporaceae bacterium]
MGAVNINTWIFQGNPKIFDIDAYLVDFQNIWWSIRQKQYLNKISIGDTIYLWRSDGDKKASGGIIARTTVTGNIIQRTDDEAKNYWKTDGWKVTGLAVPLKVEEVKLNCMQTKRENIKQVKELVDLMILRYASMTNYLLNENEAHKINQLWNENKPNWQLVEECAREYVKYNGEPFTKKALVDFILNKYPDRNENSIRPMIQAVTVNAKGGAPSGIGKDILIRIDSNKYKLYSQTFPIIQDSWTIYDETTFVKQMDKSTFLHKGTGIPKSIKQFFNVECLKQGEKRKVIVGYQNKEFEFKIECENSDLERTRLFWKSDFADIINNKYAIYLTSYKQSQKIDSFPSIRFKKICNDKYNIEFINPNEVERDVESEETEWSGTYKEGKLKSYYGKRYERDPRNRQRAIEIHGTVCCACGFDFQKVYGNRGAGYVEIHHVNQLSDNDGEIEINPKTDLVPVCSNCHRIIHRERENVLSIEELKAILVTK